jgi:hypothetical protein
MCCVRSGPLPALTVYRVDKAALPPKALGPFQAAFDLLAGLSASEPSLAVVSLALLPLSATDAARCGFNLGRPLPLSRIGAKEPPAFSAAGSVGTGHPHPRYF